MDGFTMTNNIYLCRVCGRFTEEPIHCNKPAKLFLESHLRKQLSKLLSLVLRHKPEVLDLSLTQDGYADIDILVKKIKEKTKLDWITKQHILAVVEMDPKGRFEIKNNMIRASYGHSIGVDLKYEKLSLKEIPSVLYHGTVTRYIKSIKLKGLVPMKRQYVHLSASLEDAILVARRHKKHGDRIIILEIDPSKVIKAGYPIYKGGRNIYLVKHVPPDAISNIKTL